MATYPNGQHFYSEEEDAWLRENADCGTHQEVTDRFNRTFKTELSCSTITSHVLKTLHLHKSINRGDCKKGERRCKNTLPIGTESWDGQDVYVKISDNVNDCKNGRMPCKRDDPNWRRKDYIVWENHGNIAPQNSNEMLVHLNRDKKDCSIENLYKTSRVINLLMAKNGWYTEDRDLTLAALKWCELFYAIKEGATSRNEGSNAVRDRRHGKEAMCE